MDRKNITLMVKKILSHYKLEQLCEFIRINMDEVSIGDLKFKIKKKCRELNKKITKSELITIFAKEFVRNVEDFDHLKSRTIKLCLIDVSILPKKYCWNVFGLNNVKNQPLDLKNDELVYLIKRELNPLNFQDLEIGVHTKSNVVWIGVFFSNKKKIIKSCYFAFSMSFEKYGFMFSSGPISIVKKIAKIFSSQDVIFLNLSGHDLKSLMMQCFRNQKYKRGFLKDQNGLAEIEFLPEKKQLTKDYNRYNYRKQYAEIMIDSNCTIEKLKYDFQDIEWKGGLVQLNCNSSLELQSPNVLNSVKNLIKLGSIQAPLPEFWFNFFKSGKNKIVLKNED